jgi:hypothetical protein
LLQQIGKSTNARVVEALLKGLASLPAKLTEAQVQQALNAVLPQIRNGTDSKTLEVLGEGLKALATKLNEAQAEQVFEAALPRSAKRPIPMRSRCWARGSRSWRRS